MMLTGGSGTLFDLVSNTVFLVKTSGSSSESSESPYLVISSKVVTFRVEYFVTVDSSRDGDGVEVTTFIGAATPIGILIDWPGPPNVTVISLPTFDCTGELHRFDVSWCCVVVVGGVDDGGCHFGALWGFAKDGRMLNCRD